MITISVSTDAFSKHDVQGYAVIVTADSAHEVMRDLESIFPGLSVYAKQRSFEGKAQQQLMYPIVHKGTVKYAILAGLGERFEQKPIDIEVYRRALGTVIREAGSRKIEQLVLRVPAAEQFEAEDAYLAGQTALIAHMAYYHFTEFMTDEARAKQNDLHLILVADKKNESAVNEGVSFGQLCARGVNEARSWVDTPADHMTPIGLVQKAQEIAQANDLKITIFNEQEVNQMGLGGLAAVSRGSERDCQLVILEYIPEDTHAPTVGLVGKGITFDSGGLSIKPADYMETMKDDMAGAAAILGAMDVIGALKPAVHVVAVMPLAENLPSGKAVKPGDIVTFYNGKTAEIRNTDAEGRLILADALSYITKHYRLDSLIDLATLTGACSHALGPIFSGLLSKDDLLVTRIERAAKRSGDRVWRLPLTDEYQAAIKSDIADIKNVGSPRYRAGATTAACFLSHFVGDVPWAHIDIAGTAFDVPDVSYFRSGATGYGVRLLVELVLNW